MLAKLGDVANVYNGKTPARSEQRDSGHPVLKIRDVDEFGNFRGKFNSFVDKTFANSHSAKKINANDIFILNAAHNADYVGSKTFIATNEVVGALPTGEWTIIRAKLNQLLPKYFYFWLSSIHGKSAIKQIVRGIHLYPSDVANIKIHLPSFSEQERIVRLLDEAESLRATRKHADARMEQFVPALFQEMFGETELREEKLGKLTERITKGESPGWQGFSYVEDGPLFVTSENVLWREIDISSPKRIPIKFHQKLKRSMLKSNDVLVNLVGASIGRSCIVPKNIGEANINQAVAVITPNENLLSDYLCSFILSTKAQEILNIGKVESARANVSLTDLNNLDIPLPPLALQHEFAARVEAARGVQSAQGRSAGRIEALYQSMLSRAFAGEL